MSETRYFVRTQGRVSGPFTVPQIRALHQRGHFGRFHEVSVDQRSWQQASALADLFPILMPPVPAAPAPKPQPPQDRPKPPAASAAPAAPAEAPPPSIDTSPSPAAAPQTMPPHWQDGDWYYQGRNGEPEGPTSLAQLHDQRGKGAVTDATLVCKPGMDSWIELADALRDPKGRSNPATTSSPQEIEAALRRENIAFLIALGAGALSAASVVPLFVGLVLPATSVVRAALLGLSAMLLFAGLAGDIAAYVCSMLGPRGGSGRQLAASALILAVCELMLRAGMIAILDFSRAQAAYGPGGNPPGLMLAALATSASWGRTLLFLLYLCQAAQRQQQPLIVRRLLQSLPIFGAVVVLGLLFLLAVLVCTAADMGGTEDPALNIAWMLGLLFVGAAWLWWLAIYLIALYRMSVSRRAGLR